MVSYQGQRPIFHSGRSGHAWPHFAKAGIKLLQTMAQELILSITSKLLFTQTTHSCHVFTSFCHNLHKQIIQNFHFIFKKQLSRFELKDVWKKKLLVTEIIFFSKKLSLEKKNVLSLFPGWCHWAMVRGATQMKWNFCCEWNKPSVGHRRRRRCCSAIAPAHRNLLDMASFLNGGKDLGLPVPHD